MNRMRVLIALAAAVGALALSPRSPATAQACLEATITDAPTSADGSQPANLTVAVSHWCYGAVSYIAIGTDGLTRVGPTPGSYRSGTGRPYHVEWTGQTGLPGFASIKFNSIGEGYYGTDSFTVAVKGYAPGQQLKVAVKAGTNLTVGYAQAATAGP